MIGLAITDAQLPCIMVSNIKVYSTSEFSVYWRVAGSIVGKNMQLVDNRGGRSIEWLVSALLVITNFAYCIFADFIKADIIPSTDKVLEN